MKEETKVKLRLIRLFYIKIKSRYDKGRSLIGSLIDFGQISIVAGLGIELWNRWDILGIQIPVGWLWKIMILLAFSFLFLGWLDQTKIKLTQAEAEYSSTFLNPFLGKISENIKIIKEQLKNKTK